MIDEIDESMLEDSVTIHDQYQFEIKWSFKFSKEKKDTTYDIETYFFIPPNLGINKNSYAKHDFYNDLKTYIRFKTPVILIQKIAGGPDSLMGDLERVLKAVANQPEGPQLIEYEDRIKLFCRELKSSLRDHVAHIRSIREIDDARFLLEQYIDCTDKISRAYREFRKILNVPTINKKTFSKYLFGDEFISLTIEDYTYKLLDLLNKPEYSEMKGGFFERLLDIIRKETEYRRRSSYPSIAETDSDNEVFNYRKSILKKYMGNILFLDIRTENDGRFVEQIAFGVAAGLSMIFATVIAWFIQRSYGNLSFPLFIALIVSYMFKDRIKEILRIYFSGKTDKFLFNYKNYIHTRDHKLIGWCKELFRFRSESEIPDEILKLRNKDHITEIENDWMGEHIVLYKKMIRLYTNDFGNIGNKCSIDSINDIMRFNVQKFLTKMDNPVKPVYALSGNTYKKVFAKRVYHLNLIIKYSYENKALFKRFRIILSRNGIKKIELV